MQVNLINQDFVALDNSYERKRVSKSDDLFYKSVIFI